MTGLVLGMLPHACLPQADVADNPALARYLADSVLARLPAPAVALLHDAAPFARFDAALCDALGPRDDSRAILDELERRHLFVKPLGDGWYRFHALFAEHLCTRLHRAEPGRERALRLRAAHWFAARGHWREAVAEALAIGDDALALPWAEAFSRRMVETGEVAVVADWLGGLPLRLRQHSLPLRLIQAWASAFSLDLRRARRALADLEADIAAGRLVNLYPAFDVAVSEAPGGAWIVYPSRSYVPAKVRAFIEFLREAVAGPVPHASSSGRLP